MSLLVDKLSRIGREIRLNPDLRRDILDSPFPSETDKEVQATAPSQKTSEGGEMSGVRIVTTPENLPRDLRAAWDEIREITPLYAKLHSALSAAESDEERKETADELCRLDDRRRSLWDKIDSWASGKELRSDEPRPEYSSDVMLSGLQMAARRKRLKDNIRTAQLSVTKYTNNGNEASLRKDRERLGRYQAELDSLERMIADAEG